MVRRARKTPAKTVTLDPRVWLRNAHDIKVYKALKLKTQKGKCAVTGCKLENPVVDHAHEDCNPYQEDGRVRGLLESQVNMLEGRFLKLFKNSRIEEKYGISFPDFLINLGEYLKLDNSEEKFHYAYMNDKRKEIKLCLKSVLAKKLKDEFGLCPSESMKKDEMVQLYMQEWVRNVEKLF